MICLHYKYVRITFLCFNQKQEKKDWTNQTWQWMLDIEIRFRESGCYRWSPVNWYTDRAPHLLFSVCLFLHIPWSYNSHHLFVSLYIQYMHERNILHRDLKTQNIFLTKSKIIKVGDLGIARVLEGSNDMATTLIGTPYYMSPELFSNRPYNHKVSEF